MSRIHANNFSTTLNGSITNSQTTITLSSVTGFPTIGSGVTCYVSVDDGVNQEIMTATARSSFDLTVTRGAESTTAASFTSGTAVEIRATADSIDRKLDSADLTDANISTSDITTNNVSISKHGFAPKAPNDATKYLDGTGAWTVPAGGGSGGLVKISTQTSSSSTALSFTTGIDSTYDNYLFIVSDFQGSTAAMQVEVSFDGGSTWKTTSGYNQASIYIASSGSTVSGYNDSNGTSFGITAFQGQNSSSSPIGGTVSFMRASATNAAWEWKMTILGSGGGYAKYITGGGMFDDSTSPPINAVRFKFSSGATITTGSTVTMYGYEK